VFLISHAALVCLRRVKQITVVFGVNKSESINIFRKQKCSILKVDEVLERRQLSVVSKLVRVRVDRDAAIHLWCLHCRLLVWHSHGHTEVELRVGLDQIRKLSSLHILAWAHNPGAG